MVAPTDEIIIAVLVFYGAKGSIKFIDHRRTSVCCPKSAVYVSLPL